MLKISRTTSSQRTFVLLLSLFVAGCASPVRVEWGFKNDGEPKTEDGQPAPLGLSGQWAAWQSLHEQLIRRIEERRYGDRVPTDTLEESRKALDQLANRYPDESEAFAAVRALYQELDEARKLGSTSRHARQLERAAQALVRAHR